MIDAVAKALNQMFTPPFRRVLLKAIGLALIMIVMLGVGMYYGFTWLAELGTAWGQSNVGVMPSNFWTILAWILSFAISLGIITGGIFLMPAVTAFVGSFFVDEIADQVEGVYYPTEMPGAALPLFRALLEGVKTALLTIAIYVVALPFVLFAGLGLVILFLANAYLLSREYFELAAMRFRPPAEAKALRRAHRGQVFFAGLFIAAFVSIPVVNLATPLFAMALMVHLHKRLSGRRVEITEAKAPRLSR
ncbi:MAG TPA: sulfate transporter family protein [Xanthobacteraceae bacterium]|jgi:CysZ protein|nr:sulfate transporter family protein [Xanthobacteraceae bacterium]